MSLSDHSESIHVSLRKLKDNMKKLTVVEGLNGWFQSLGFTELLKDLIKQGLLLLIVIIVILMIVPCIIQCVSRTLHRSMEKIWVTQLKQKGGTVGAFLEENGHVYDLE